MHDKLTIDRRDFLRLGAIGFAGSMLGWLPALAAGANERKPAKSVILLWMNGGPATIDLWDLKPGHANGGPFKEIDTAAPGLKISENLPKLATHGREIAIIRSMTTKEGDHARAHHLARTGYSPQGAIQFPALGSLVGHATGAEDHDLPCFVSIAPRFYSTTVGGGFLGPRFSPLAVGQDATSGNELKVPDLAPIAGVGAEDQADRMRLWNGMEQRFAGGKGSDVVASFQAATMRAVQLMHPEAARAFRLADESDAVRDRYGRSVFGQGCLLARRLVERGVSFVEVTLDGWDTHANNFELVKGLSGTLDGGAAALLADLKERGLLDSTLVVCMGEFGRTPKINTGTGRDHWPQSWSTLLVGGGIHGGQAIGRTSADGTAVEECPVKMPDLIATIATVLGIDPTRQNMSNVARPIRIADFGAKPVGALL